MHKHISVLLHEIIDSLKPKNGIIIDATLGLGGHTKEILKVSKARVIGIDQDGEALELAKNNLKDFKDRVTFIQGNFSQIEKIAKGADVLGKISGVLMDVGVSSYQFDEASRGFSLKENGPLDMRMDKDGSLSAYEIINSWPEVEIARVLYEFGDEYESRRIAKKIVEERRKDKITSTLKLAEIIKNSVSKGRAFGKIHPATKSFQALRICVNDELGSLSKGLEQSLKVIKKDGILAVISFHSLEDRIVKRFFKDMASNGQVEVLTKKPIVPTLDETRSNPRSRSAKLRVAKVL
ncbi:16S rRNA (cytosine(1402)-N(4))-methyltransferase RsmH [bacterium]|nr:16S rRNA (cytosine(1402)-N(4))-methyltransferase RsmH [bacterium]